MTQSACNIRLRVTLGLALFVLAAVLGTPAFAQEGKPVRRILAIGGGAMGRQSTILPKHIVSLTGKKNPLIYCLPTAGGDSATSIVRWYEVMHQFECRPRHLRLFDDSFGMKNLEARLLAADAIYVGGGNTMNMLAVWKEHGIDRILRKAWERGILLTGESAGMICWFEQGVTDSRAGKLTPLDCLGFLPGSACPHYKNEAARKPAYHKMLLAGEIKEGVACDDGAALLFEGTRLTRVVATSSLPRAYRVRRAGDKIVEEALKLDVLPK